MGLTISSVLTRLFGKKQMRILMGESFLFDKLFNVNVVIFLLTHYLYNVISFVAALDYLGT